MSRAPRCLTTAMSHGDSRTTSSIVGRDHRRVRVAVGAATCRPSRRSSGRLPARRPPPRSPRPRGARSARAGGSRSPRARSRGPSAAAGAPAGRGSPPRTAACPRAPRRCRAPSARPSAAPSATRRSGSAPRRSSGFATGIRTRAGSGCPVFMPRPRPRRARRSRRPARGNIGPPAVDEVWLEQLELARLALDPLLGVGRGQVAVLDHEAADPPEVDRHQRGHELAGVDLAPARRDHQVVDQAGPQVVGEVEARPAPRPSRASTPAPCRPRRRGPSLRLAASASLPASAASVRTTSTFAGIDRPAPRVGHGERAARGTRTAAGSRSPRAAAGR